jgi:hypothetical protein
LSAARILEELRRLALVDARSFWDEQGRLKPLSELTAEQGAALASFEVIGLATERLEVSGWDKLAAQLNHARTVGPTASISLSSS